MLAATDKAERSAITESIHYFDYRALHSLHLEINVCVRVRVRVLAIDVHRMAIVQGHIRSQPKPQGTFFD